MPGQIIRIDEDGSTIMNLGASFISLWGQNHKKRRQYRLEQVPADPAPDINGAGFHLRRFPLAGPKNDDAGHCSRRAEDIVNQLLSKYAAVSLGRARRADLDIQQGTAAGGDAILNSAGTFLGQGTHEVVSHQCFDDTIDGLGIEV